jgi:hypothetical protein
VEKTIKDSLLLFGLLLLCTFTLSGCEFIGDVFQAGVWVGALLVILVIGAVVWMISKGRT